MTTPMLKQYKEIKDSVPDSLLFFRLGDFYEMFGEDAQIAAPILEIALTSRDAGKGNRIPMCGVPYHSADNYLYKLVSSGHKVAICEQVEDPDTAKGIVKREVVRIVTPGTLDIISNETKNNYLAALYREKEWGLAYLDITTGDFKIMQAPTLQPLENELNRINPSELLIPKDLMILPKMFTNIYTSKIDKSLFKSTTELTARFKQQDNLLNQSAIAAKAAAGLWKYVNQNIPDSPKGHILNITSIDNNKYMLLDKWTRLNLELVEPIRSNSKDQGTLFSILNFTKTAFGSRLLRHCLQQPLINKAEILQRQNIVQEFTSNVLFRKEIQRLLSNVYDIERLMGKISYGRANAKDMLSLGNTLGCLQDIRKVITEYQAEYCSNYLKTLSGMDKLAQTLLEAINPEAPASLKEGNIIAEGYNAEIDHLRFLSKGGKDFIANLESKEKERTKIRSLKIGFNRVFGYYIEVTNANAHLVPADYQRKQTLVNAERFVTPELKEYEHKVLTAQEQLIELEYSLFLELKEEVLVHSSKIMKAAQALAEVDIFSSLAEAAVRFNYKRPELREDGVINIIEGRHPVVEQMLAAKQFVPNDTLLDSHKHLALVTGPNMAGKSTYMRQVALIVLMCQIGSFVPAQKASLSIVDCIYTRIGAADNLVMGQSTFMVEMNEVGYILNNATNQSLVILDEVGRGTSTYDGLSLAWAIAEYLLEKPHLKPKTLFATHYHELTQLEKHYDEIFNLHVAVKEQGDEITFLHKIIPGKADRSYGIHVAQIAGLPPDLIKRASVILKELESNSTENLISEPEESFWQQSLFESPRTHPILEEIQELDPDNISPRQALDYLYELASRVKAYESK